MMNYLAPISSSQSLKSWKRNSVLGFCYALSSAITGAASALCIKLVRSADADEILMVRWFAQYVVLLPLASYRGEIMVENNASVNVALALRVIAGTGAATLSYHSFKLMPAGDATAIMFTYIVMVGLLSFILLKEPCGIADIILTALSLLGLLFISQPSFIFETREDQMQAKNRPLGIVLGTLSALLVAVALVCIRKMGTDVHFSLSLLYLSLAGFVLSIIRATTSQTTSLLCSYDLLVMMLVAGFALLSIILQTMALQLEEAGPMTIVMTTQVIFAFLLEFVFLGVRPSLYSMIGAAIISCSSVGLLILNICRKEALKKLEPTDTRLQTTLS